MITGKPLEDRQVVIIGAGPAGLTAAYELTNYGLNPLVFEKLDKVGGIARTENYQGFHFDMGGHRFFTKSAEVNRMWHGVLNDDFLLRPRLSRIYYNRKFFDYPLKPFDALSKFGIWESMLVALSYLRWQIFPSKHEDSFEQWVTNRFGKRLFNIFFKSYTEKVWGISTSELRAEWAAQRIKDLSLKTAVLNMFVKSKDPIKTLIEEFHYPRLGPGMLWNEVKERIEQKNGKIHLNSPVTRIHRSGNRIDSIVACQNGQEKVIVGSDFISSMAITEFIQKLDPPPPPVVLEAASKLSYREFLTVCLIINRVHLFDDNWIYIHDPDVKVGRIQNFKNWSPDMVPDASQTSLGLEYFCNEGDDLWNAPDGELIELGKREIEHIGLARYEEILDGSVFRVEKSYPVYDANYGEHLAIIRGYLESLENFQTIGRNGLHRYNNQDHAMLTGMLAVRNVLFGQKNDLWKVNAEQEYHEEVREAKRPSPAEVLDEAFAQAFYKIDSVAYGLAVGITVALFFWLLTLFVASKDNPDLIYLFFLLRQYFPAYRPTITESWLALVYGFLAGFLFGWGVTALRNFVIRFYVQWIRRRAEIELLEEYGILPDDQSRTPFNGED